MLKSPPFPLSIEEIDASFLSENLGININSFQYERIGADRGMVVEINKETIQSDTGSK